MRSLRNIPTETHIPDLQNARFVAPNCTVIGDVKFGKNSSLWYGSVARGDLQRIEIGENTVIQDLVTIKSHDGGSNPIIIGKNVFVGPNSKIGGCTLHDYSFVGMGATIEDGCVVESYGFLAAGALLCKGSIVPSGQIWAGSPAHFLREVTIEEREAVNENLNEMNDLAEVHAEETEKSFDQVFVDDLQRQKKFNNTWTDSFYEKLEKLGFTGNQADVYEDEFVRGNQRYQTNERFQTDSYNHDNYRPFNEDAVVFPDSWKVYGEDMARYERAKKVFDAPAPVREEPNRPSIPTNQIPWTKRY